MKLIFFHFLMMFSRSLKKTHDKLRGIGTLKMNEERKKKNRQKLRLRQKLFEQQFSETMNSGK